MDVWSEEVFVRNGDVDVDVVATRSTRLNFGSRSGFKESFGVT